MHTSHTDQVAAERERLRPYLNLLNQVFDIERKLEKMDDPGSLGRNVRKMRSIFETELLPNGGLVYEDPIGQPYDETRSDCEASIAGDTTDNLVIVDVIKPIIRYKSDLHSRIIQPAVVTVRSQDADATDSPS